jgi:hypothetical protein
LQFLEASHTEMFASLMNLRWESHSRIPLRSAEVLRGTLPMMLSCHKIVFFPFPGFGRGIFGRRLSHDDRGSKSEFLWGCFLLGDSLFMRSMFSNMYMSCLFSKYVYHDICMLIKFLISELFV